MAEYIDCTPTWSGILPVILTALRDATPEGQRMAGDELRRMARLADQVGDMARELDEAEERYGRADHDLRVCIEALIDIEEGGGDAREVARNALNRMTCAGSEGE